MEAGGSGGLWEVVVVRHARQTADTVRTKIHSISIFATIIDLCSHSICIYEIEIAYTTLHDVHTDDTNIRASSCI